jgi:hypothetical protein
MKWVVAKLMCASIRFPNRLIPANWLIAADIDRLTEHWDAEAVASVAPGADYWRKPRSLLLTVLIRRGSTLQSRELYLSVDLFFTDIGYQCLV